MTYIKKLEALLSSASKNLPYAQQMELLEALAERVEEYWEVAHSMESKNDKQIRDEIENAPGERTSSDICGDT